MNPVRRNPDRPKVPDLVPLIFAVYERNGAGCCLHVVTDDANWDSVAWVIENLKPGHADCRAAAEMMAQMTESQISRATARAFAAERCSVCGMYWSVCGHKSKRGLL